MSTLLFLTSTDFNIQKNQKGMLLCHGIRGFSLVLFYSTICSYCQSLIPIFKKLPEKVGGCQFAMVNISQNKDLIGMAKNTLTPINYVPYIILYVDGTPFMRYDGPRDENEIKNFIFEVAKNVKSKQQFTEGKVEQPEKEIPRYTIGTPLCGEDGVCYLSFNGKDYIENKDKVNNCYKMANQTGK